MHEQDKDLIVELLCNRVRELEEEVADNYSWEAKYYGLQEKHIKLNNEYFAYRQSVEGENANL